MTEIVVAQRMWQRRGTADEWLAANPIMAEGEIGFEIEADPLAPIKMKVGNGAYLWTDLPYFAGGGGGGTVEMQAGVTHIQYRNDPADPWLDLVALADLQGPPGAPGPAIEMSYDATYIQYRVVGDADWTNLIARVELQGASAYQAALDEGYVGTQVDWLLTLRGKSAYQSAVDTGFVGTEAEWVASLQSSVQGPAGGPTEVLNTSGAITLDAAAHKGKMLLHNTGVITLPETAAAGFVTNDIVEVRRQGAGAVSFAVAGAAVMDFNTTLYSAAILNSKDIVGLKVIAANTWALVGPLADA